MPRWIDVNKELPETKRGVHAKKHVVACIYEDNSDIGFAKYSKKEGWHAKSFSVKFTLITHWLESKLPKFKKKK